MAHISAHTLSKTTSVHRSRSVYREPVFTLRCQKEDDRRSCWLSVATGRVISWKRFDRAGDLASSLQARRCCRLVLRSKRSAAEAGWKRQTLQTGFLTSKHTFLVRGSLNVPTAWKVAFFGSVCVCMCVFVCADEHIQFVPSIKLIQNKE